MMFTKKHYEMIAKVIADCQPVLSKDSMPLSGILYDARRHKVLNIAIELADMFAKDNPRFDRYKFYKASNIDEESS